METDFGELLIAGLFVLGACMIVFWPLNHLIGLPQWAVAALTFLMLLLFAPLFLLYFALPLAAMYFAVERFWTRPRALKEAEAAARRDAERTEASRREAARKAENERLRRSMRDAEYAAASRKAEARAAAEAGHERKRAARRERRRAAAGMIRRRGAGEA